jgi:hypothetical protein
VFGDVVHAAASDDLFDGIAARGDLDPTAFSGVAGRYRHPFALARVSGSGDIPGQTLLHEFGHALSEHWMRENGHPYGIDPVGSGGNLDPVTIYSYYPPPDDDQVEWATLYWGDLIISYTQYDIDGNVIDYQAIYEAIVSDVNDMVIVDVTYDKWCGEPVRQELENRTGLTMVESSTTYDRMTGPMTEVKRAIVAGELAHGGNPVARWMAEHLRAKSPADDPDRCRPVKPARDAEHARIDGMPALIFAMDGRMRVDAGISVYESRGLITFN